MTTKRYHNSSSLTRAELKQLALGQQAEIEDYKQQIKIFCIIAYYRAGQMSKESAILTLGTTEDNFARCLSIADTEALKIIGALAKREGKGE